MIFSDTLQLALRNLKEAKLRTALTTLGVAIGIGSLVSMVSLGVGLQEQTVGRFMKSGMFDSITVFQRQPARNVLRARRANPQNENSRTDKPAPPLDDTAVKNMNSIPNVREIYPNVRIPVELKYKDFSDFSVAMGVPMSSRGEGVFQTITYGSFFSNQSGDDCMLSLEMANRLPERKAAHLIGKEVTLGYATTGQAGAGMFGDILGGMSLQRVERKFRVIGIVDREPGPGFGGGIFSSVMIPLGKAREIGAVDVSNPQGMLRQLSKRPAYSSVTIRVAHPRDTDDVEKKIKEMGFNAFSFNDALQGAKRAFIVLDIILGVIGSIALAVASLGIVNTMVMSILERTREIGVMKAIGGGEGDIRMIFLVESSVIGMMGGVSGIALGWMVGRVINFGANIYIQRQGGNPGDLFSIPWWLIVAGVVFSILVSLAAGSYPAARAAHVDPIKALRHD
ncbi:MAG TPA: ABC transporter permease [Acidobacteriota bacterium]|jgi:putative ABC transport system permease protein